GHYRRKLRFRLAPSSKRYPQRCVARFNHSQGATKTLNAAAQPRDEEQAAHTRGSRPRARTRSPLALTGRPTPSRTRMTGPPIRLLGFNTDNDSVFMNETVRIPDLQSQRPGDHDWTDCGQRLRRPKCPSEDILYRWN